MKRIVKLNLIFIALFCIMFFIGNVYAALSGRVSLEATKTEVEKDEEFIIDVKLCDIQSEVGIISLGGTLEYDKDSLTLLGMQGQNNWDTPVDKFSYNPENGKLVVAKNGLAKEDETVFTIKFKVKDTSKTETNITLKDITVADGTEPADINIATRKVVLKKGTQGGNQQPEQNTITNNTTTNSNTNSQTTTNKVSDTTTKNETLPKTGTKSVILITVIGIIIIAIVISYVNYRKIRF